MQKLKLLSQLVFLLLISFIVLHGCSAPKHVDYNEKVIMAIFAHPDDEISVAPILHKYSQLGAKVYVVSVTDGRYGSENSGMSPGDALAERRKGEFSCAATVIGATAIWLGYHDQLRLAEGYDGHVPLARKLLRQVDSLVKVIKPDVLITWGPDGGTNHMDHRLVGATVAQVFAQKLWDKPSALYFRATSTQKLDNEEDQILRGVDESYLTMQVPFSATDAQKAMQALQCYTSQYLPEQIAARRERVQKDEYVVYLRPFAKSSQQREDLF